MNQAQVLQIDGTDFSSIRPVTAAHMAEVIIDSHGRVLKNRYGPKYTPTWRNLVKDLRSLIRRKKKR